jgi:hypothetical protein
MCFCKYINGKNYDLSNNRRSSDSIFVKKYGATAGQNWSSSYFKSHKYVLCRYCRRSKRRILSGKKILTIFSSSLKVRKFETEFSFNLLYRTSGVIFFIDYCTAIRDTKKG